MSRKRGSRSIAIAIAAGLVIGGAGVATWRSSANEAAPGAPLGASSLDAAGATGRGEGGSRRDSGLEAAMIGDAAIGQDAQRPPSRAQDQAREPAWHCVDASRVSASGPLPSAATAASAPEVSRAVERQIARLAASASPLDRAFATIAQASEPGRPALDEAVPAATTEVAGREPLAWVESLAGQALAGGDPGVYGMAFRNCRTSMVSRAAGPACARLSAYHWARLDPGNSVPWLHVADEARRASDFGTFDEALHHMATAARADETTSAVAAAIDRTREPGEAGDQAAVQLWTRVVGVMAAWVEPLDLLAASCRPDRLGGDANRRQVCVAVAHQLSTRSDTLLLAVMGARTEAALTGDDGAWRSLRAAGSGLQRTLGQDSGRCAATRRMASYLARVGQVGERATALEAPGGETAPLPSSTVPSPSSPSWSSSSVPVPR